MFELTQHRPSYWGPPESNKHTSQERESHDCHMICKYFPMCSIYSIAT